MHTYAGRFTEHIHATGWAGMQIGKRVKTKQVDMHMRVNGNMQNKT